MVWLPLFYSLTFSTFPANLLCTLNCTFFFYERNCNFPVELHTCSLLYIVLLFATFISSRSFYIARDLKHLFDGPSAKAGRSLSSDVLNVLVKCRRIFLLNWSSLFIFYSCQILSVIIILVVLYSALLSITAVIDALIIVL